MVGRIAVFVGSFILILGICAFSYGETYSDPDILEAKKESGGSYYFRVREQGKNGPMDFGITIDPEGKISKIDILIERKRNFLT